MKSMTKMNIIRLINKIRKTMKGKNKAPKKAMKKAAKKGKAKK